MNSTEYLQSKREEDDRRERENLDCGIDLVDGEHAGQLLGELLNLGPLLGVLAKLR